MLNVKLDSGAPAAPAEAPANVQDGANGGVVARHAEPAAEAPATETPATPERPKWLNEKFKTPEDLAAAYDALEKKLGQPKAEEKPAEKPKADAPVDREALAREVREQIAREEATKVALTAAVGDEQTLKSVLEWANTNADASLRQAYNAAVDAGNAALASLIAGQFKSQYTAAVGAEPARVTGQPAANGGPQPFASQGELIAAMSDPRYSKDAAYRTSIENRMRVTTLF